MSLKTTIVKLPQTIPILIALGIVAYYDLYEPADGDRNYAVMKSDDLRHHLSDVFTPCIGMGLFGIIMSHVSQVTLENIGGDMRMFLLVHFANLLFMLNSMRNLSFLNSLLYILLPYILFHDEALVTLESSFKILLYKGFLSGLGIVLLVVFGHETGLYTIKSDHSIVTDVWRFELLYVVFGYSFLTHLFNKRKRLKEGPCVDQQLKVGTQV